MNPNENPSPLPQPMRNTCPHCGFGWNETTQFCPRCGAAVAPAASQKYQPATMVFLGCALFMVGAVGACFTLLGFSGGINRDVLNPFSAVGVVLIGVVLFLFWKMVRRGR